MILQRTKTNAYMKVSLERCSGLCLLIAGVRAASFLKTIAVVPAGSMLGPWTHADPAKLVFTLAARHVVASSVLFNSRQAFSTLFGMG